MEQEAFYDVYAYVGCMALILGYLPQAVRTICTRNTDGISLPAFLFMGVGSFCFMVQGFIHKPEIIWSMALSNLVTTACSIIIFGIKLYNDFFKKKKR